jgi:hypothetical protein
MIDGLPEDIDREAVEAVIEITCNILTSHEKAAASRKGESMKEFDVTITEKLQTVVTVEANTKEEAEQMSATSALRRSHSGC